MLPYPLEACPADLLAAHPPSVTYSNDCGQCPSVRPCAASARSSSGPRMPAPTVTIRDSRSSSTSWAIRRMSRAITPPCSPRSGSTPPDHARSAAERHDRQPAACAQLEHGPHLLMARRQHDRVRRPLRRARAHAHEVDITLAGGVHHPFGVVLSHPVWADDRLQRRPRALRQPGVRQLHSAERDRRARRARDADRLPQQLQRRRAQSSNRDPDRPTPTSASAAAACDLSTPNDPLQTVEGLLDRSGSGGRFSRP